VTAIGYLARYRIISKHGSGGMATVDLAEDTVLGRRVALKRMSGEADVNGLTRLRREALVGASFSHANLVSVYDVLDTDDGHLVIVTEYVEGETLRQVLTRRGRLPLQDALPILAGVAAGLDAINERGIVHRDVKPSNILLGGGRAGVTVKLADLGIASAPDRTRITSSGAVLGSLSYMAPEQLSDAPATRAIDVYALAAVTFEVLSGVKARREGNVVALAHAISTQAPPSLQEAWPGAPRGLDAVLRRAMGRDPRQRPRSAGELVARLRTAREPEGTVQLGRPATARPLLAFDEPARRRPRTGVIAAALLGLAVIAAAVVALLSSGGSPTRRQAASSATTARTTRTVAPSPPSSTSTPTASATPSSTSTPTASATPSTPTLAAGDPVSAVKSFYTLAAAHRYAAAWALADASMRGQVGINCS
jgi:serine/threonine protein kinase